MLNCTSGFHLLPKHLCILKKMCIKFHCSKFLSNETEHFLVVGLKSDTWWCNAEVLVLDGHKHTQLLCHSPGCSLCLLLRWARAYSTTCWMMSSCSSTLGKWKSVHSLDTVAKSDAIGTIEDVIVVYVSCVLFWHLLIFTTKCYKLDIIPLLMPLYELTLLSTSSTRPQSDVE